jgi:exosome complex component CSL4
MSVKTGDIVNVSDELGHVEVYLGSDDTTFIVDDKIFAAVPGIVEYNEDNRIVRVKSIAEEKRLTPKKGDIIVGTVYSIRKTTVGVRLRLINNRMLHHGRLIGNIHISQVSRSYIEKPETAFQKTDIIRATVSGKRNNEWQLSTVDNDMGVIFSECKFCGTALNRKSRGDVVCPFCNNMERRKLSSDFNSVEEVVLF